MLGLLTNDQYPQLTPDDQIFSKELTARGVPWVPVNWNSGLPPMGITHLLIRSPWDYHFKPQAFLDYLKSCEEKGIEVINNTEIVRWNYSKIYLEELSRKGLDIVDSVFVLQDSKPGTLATLLTEKGWSDIVIKPAVSGSSRLTYQTHVDSPELTTQAQSILEENILVAQPYLPSIRDEGEVSIVYYCAGNKPEYSHAVIKRPKSGDFRVQNEFGGSSVYMEPNDEMKALCEKILKALPHFWLYVRIDLVDCSRKPLISEIELIEPALYFTYHPPAAARFAEIIAKRCGHTFGGFGS